MIPWPVACGTPGYAAPLARGVLTAAQRMPEWTRAHELPLAIGSVRTNLHTPGQKSPLNPVRARVKCLPYKQLLDAESL